MTNLIIGRHADQNKNLRSEKTAAYPLGSQNPKSRLLPPILCVFFPVLQVQKCIASSRQRQTANSVAPFLFRAENANHTSLITKSMQKTFTYPLYSIYLYTTAPITKANNANPQWLMNMTATQRAAPNKENDLKSRKKRLYFQ